MAKAIIAGGLYVNPDRKTYHDANGKPVDTKKARAALLGIQVPAEEAPPTEDSSSAIAGGLPKDFPGRAAFQKAGFDSVEKVRALEDVTSVSGVGDATAGEVAEYLAKAEG